MSFFQYRDYVSVAERREKAERHLAKLRKKGKTILPVKIEGREIAKSFWGMSWCTNLERYSDYETRLPRGRTYVRNGSVVHLEIAKGKIAAMVAGSELYDVKIAIAPVKAKHWQAICRDCAGSVDSLVELLQGRLAKGVMDRVCREGDGLFPAPEEIELSCSCQDWADMCKHVAAVLYGIGARLDQEPQLLFLLRDVDENELLARAGQDLPMMSTAPNTEKLLDDSDVAALFGLEMAEVGDGDAASPVVAERPQRAERSKERNAPSGKKASGAKKSKSLPPVLSRVRVKRAGAAGPRRAQRKSQGSD
jgi:uncharacterized Zn finger protein